MQTKQKLIKEKFKPVLKVGLVGLKNMTAGALSHYLQSEHSEDVVILDAYGKPTDGPSQATDLDVVVLGTNLHSLKELESWKVIGPSNNGPKLAVYCDNFDPNFAWSALRRGAKGIISGDTNVEALPIILDLIASGQVFVPPSMISAGCLTGANHTGCNIPLDDMQMTVLRMIADGHINKEIALAVSVSEMHIKMTVRNICKVLDAKNRSHAVAKSIRLGLI